VGRWGTMDRDDLLFFGGLAIIIVVIGVVLFV
jgi:hypothetical protein